MNKKNSIRHKIVTSKYFELSGLLLIDYSLFLHCADEKRKFSYNREYP